MSLTLRYFRAMCFWKWDRHSAPTLVTQAYQSLAVMLSRSVRIITRQSVADPQEASSAVQSPGAARRAHTPTPPPDRVRTLTGGGRHSNDGSTPGTGTAATAAEGAAPAAAAVVLFRGLRVRMGIHTGALGGVLRAGRVISGAPVLVVQGRHRHGRHGDTADTRLMETLTLRTQEWRLRQR